MKRKTSTEPNIVPLLKGPTIAVSGSWIPYIPFTGASKRSSTRLRKSSGEATYLKEPAIGLPPVSSLYWPDAIPLPLALLDPERHGIAVDVGHLQMRDLGHA